MSLLLQGLVRSACLIADTKQANPRCALSPSVLETKQALCALWVGVLFV